jgi:hypothetical protein
LRKLSTNANQFLEKIIKNIKIYNPLPEIFFVKMAFYALRNYRNKILFALEASISQNKDFFESDSSDEEQEIIQKEIMMLKSKHCLTP